MLTAASNIALGHCHPISSTLSFQPVSSHLTVGLASLGSEDEEVWEDLKNVLYTDSAVAGEAAGIGMGLLMAGSGSDKAAEMLAYAHDTQHEKIIRGKLASGPDVSQQVQLSAG